MVLNSHTGLIIIMSLHPDLNNLTVLCREVIAADDASKTLDYRRAKATNSAVKLMFELARNEMNLELETRIRRLRHDLNNFYTKHELAYWVPSTGVNENATKTRNVEEGS